MTSDARRLASRVDEVQGEQHHQNDDSSGGIDRSYRVDRSDARRRAGRDDRARLRRRDEHRQLLVLGSDRDRDVPRPTDRAVGRSRALRDRARAGVEESHSDAAALSDPDRLAERVRDRAQSRARGRRRDRRHSPVTRRAGTRGRDRARAGARHEPRHPHQLDRGDARRRDHDAREHGALEPDLRRHGQP